MFLVYLAYYFEAVKYVHDSLTIDYRDCPVMG